jgi:hypothetical protein
VIVFEHCQWGKDLFRHQLFSAQRRPDPSVGYEEGQVISVGRPQRCDPEVPKWPVGGDLWPIGRTGGRPDGSACNTYTHELSGSRGQ